jgi:aryl-alcohol dehydrogenase-like predicted oxidoreductase
MKRRKLGGLEVSALGLGCMGMTPIYGKPDPEECVAAVHRALALGVDFFDTSDAYGNGKNEELLGRALKGRRERAVVATKFGNIRKPDGGTGVDGRPEYAVEACAASLKRLGRDAIDLYFVHRIDPKVPIEDTVGALARLVEAGKVRHVGLSEAGPETIRRAHATHPLAAVETEYSLWSRDAEAAILPACRALGIGYVAYSPLGRGFLSGSIRDVGALAADDRRREHPRFLPENIAKNVPLLAALERIAEAKGCTPAQVALAWVLAKGQDVVPIPGAKRRAWVEENAAAAEVALTAAEVAELDRAFPPGAAAGPRYPEAQLKRLGI